MRESEMVSAGSGPMKYIGRDRDGMAICLEIDGDGVIRKRAFYPSTLQPMWQKMQPRSCWKDVLHTDEIEFEKEERQAAESRRIARRAARKSKRSNKIKRKTAVAA